MFTISSEIKLLSCQKTENFNILGPLQTDFEVINKFIVILRVIYKMSSKRASDPLTLFLKPQSPAERLAAQQWGLRETAEGDAAQRATRGKGKGKGQDWEEACGAPVRLQKQAFTSCCMKTLTSLSRDKQGPASEHCEASATATVCVCVCMCECECVCACVPCVCMCRYVCECVNVCV